MIPVILSGGAGTRLWPLSRPLYPKQFLALHSDRTLFQDTVLRAKRAGLCAPIVVCHEEHRFIVQENLSLIDAEAASIILEPSSCNTAPAIAAAALFALQDAEDPVLLIMPADHILSDHPAFMNAIATAEKMARQDYLVCLGTKFQDLHKDSSYIEIGEALDNQAYAVRSFIENIKMPLQHEEGRGNNFFVNSGIFCLKASRFLAELEAFSSDLVKQAQRAFESATKDLGFLRLGSEALAKCESISVESVVLERAQNRVAVFMEGVWADIGSWQEVWKSVVKDEQENVCKGPILTRNSRNNYIYSEDKLVAVLGCENLVVVNTPDALLVAHKDRASEVQEIVETLKAANNPIAKHHRTVYRPWGHYDSICRGDRDQVKRICVKPGAKLSLQKHFHRSEHWVVVKGVARVTKGKETLMLSENESVYLPLGIVHALENPGKIPLEIIEVQTGSYLGEDDIVRFEDLYGRA
ncbi:MAG: mannose-1-phosphate guanylyltransferase/mannose-6-phosphate isomerase [Alphaproteobacteria bacterium]